jgi:hypothetical protein
MQGLAPTTAPLFAAVYEPNYLKPISQPTLVVNGNNDIVIPTVNSYTLYQELPNAELFLIS